MSKKLSPEALTMIAERFKILSEPLRLLILYLLQDGEKSFDELTEAVAAKQPNISKHLKILQDAEIVKKNQVGNTVFYSIADQRIFVLCEAVCDALEERLKKQADVFIRI